MRDMIGLSVGKAFASAASKQRSQQVIDRAKRFQRVPHISAQIVYSLACIVFS